jgi:predicted SAM-dependent methyltransferase
MLEHLTYDEGLKALKYWFSLLKPNGIITVTVPDFDYIISEYLTKPKNMRVEALKLINDLYIYSYCQESLHKYCYNPELLQHVMCKAGFTNLERLPLNHHYFVDPVAWQVAFTGRKPADTKGGDI